MLPLERDKALPADIDPDDYSFGPVAEQQITIRSPELGLLPGEQGPANSFVETGDDIIREVVNLIPIKKPLNKNVVDVLKKNKETIEENQEKLDKALDKIEEGLNTMKQKYLEEKLRAEMKSTQQLG